MIMRILDRVWNFFWHSSLSLKLVFLWAVCITIGLVLPWAQIATPLTFIRAFSFVAGGVGWVIGAILVAIFITLFSYDLHEKTKKHFGIVLDPRFIYLRGGFLIVLVTIIVSLTFVGSARVGAEIIPLSGIVMTLLWGICVAVGGKLVQIAEEKQSYKHIFVQGVEHDEDIAYKKILGNDEEENMKLPV